MRSVSPVWICEFEQCGHVWLASSYVAPAKCAKCKKRNWDCRGGDGSKAPMVEQGLLKAVAEGGRLDGAPPAPPGKGKSERFSGTVEAPTVPMDPIVASLPDVPVVIEDGVARRAELGEEPHGHVHPPEDPFPYGRAYGGPPPPGTQVVVPRPHILDQIAKEHPKFGEKCPHNYANWMMCPTCNKGRV